MEVAAPSPSEEEGSPLSPAEQKSREVPKSWQRAEMQDVNLSCFVDRDTVSSFNGFHRGCKG